MLVFPPPHQNFLTKELRSLQKQTRNLIVDIAQVGMACTTDLISVSLPALDSRCLLQPSN